MTSKEKGPTHAKAGPSWVRDFRRAYTCCFERAVKIFPESAGQNKESPPSALVTECNGDVSPTDSAGKIFSLTAILSEYLEGPKAQENFERNAFIASSALLRARTVDSHMAHPHHDSPRKLGAFRVP
jgi:hypothetical protein